MGCSNDYIGIRHWSSIFGRKDCREMSEGYSGRNYIPKISLPELEKEWRKVQEMFLVKSKPQEEHWLWRTEESNKCASGAVFR